MPGLKNPKHDKFARLVAAGNPQTQAYVMAGYTLDKKGKPGKGGSSANASALARRPDVALRIRELQDRQAQRLGYTVDKAVAELDRMLQLAAATNQPGAGVGAIMGKCRLLGLVTDKAEISATLRRPLREPGAAREMSFEEWQEKFAPKPAEPLQ
jgi:hypothetical protein